MAPGDSPSRSAAEPSDVPAFLVLDAESVPDGRLLARVKYPDENLAPEDAVQRAQAEARERSPCGSDFVPVSFHYPVAVCILRAGTDFALQGLTCLDAPHFRPRRIVEQFWGGLAAYKEKYKERIKLVTFNGRGFDLPLLELAAFRYGCQARDYFQSTRNRLGGGHLDLLDWLANVGAVRLSGGLDLLSKLLGKPGKMTVSGEQVYQLHRAGRLQEINDYCLFDTLDTYFVFLRTRVLTGELTLEQEHILVMKARAWLAQKAEQQPALQQYLDNWGDWDPWP
ncbi:MAG: ribonuclease H-like domain-containing protein [Gemmataceae bacterium]|nr:ribonuclease H-like domain-containing protein [Gemmataceae bacterium]